jgi:hypothetical protein
MSARWAPAARSGVQGLARRRSQRQATVADQGDVTLAGLDLNDAYLGFRIAMSGQALRPETGADGEFGFAGTDQAGRSALASTSAAPGKELATC